MFEEALRALRRAVWSGGKEGKAWVSGQDEEGLYVVQVETPAGGYSIRLPDVRMVDALVGPPLKESRLEIPVPYSPHTGKAPGRVDHPVADRLSMLLAGAAAQRMSAVERISGKRITLAGFTCRGPTKADQGLEYKPFNEDGLLLHLVVRADGAEVAILGAFDQAGGEGRVENAHGAASEAAARAIQDAAAELEAGTDPVATLEKATEKADDAVHALGVGAVSTLAVAVVIAPAEGPAKVWVAVVGDSRVIQVSPDGTAKQSSELHNLGSQVAAGRSPGIHPAFALQFAGGLSRGLGGDDARPDVVTWELEPGDRLVVCTDGLGDARELEEMPLGVWHADRTADHVARITAAVDDPADATAALVGFALDNAADGYGKPDNIAVGVLALG
jgi:protein phosphatase